MALTAGTKLGPYEILAPIGKGGMGEVYRARDPRMGRDIAIKVAADRFSERFDREVRAVAALNHRNICHIYDLGPNYLVMELIEGPTLQERIRTGAVPLEEALVIARQIADGLDAAHEKGIVHRDLKPGNIKLRPDGTVKLLDFGLAKISEAPAPDSSDLSHSPTLTMGATMAGMLLGTAAYMAPEQAKGRPVDKRADIWAFGAVLYEMLTGRKAFAGDDVSEVLAAILRDDVDWSALPTATPAHVRSLLRHCFEKDPKRRLRDIGDVSLLLDVARGPSEEAGPKPSGPGRSMLAWTIAIFCVVASVVGFLVHRAPADAPAPMFKVSVTLPDKAEFVDSPPAVSPDGRRIAFVARSTGQNWLWVRDVDVPSARMLAGTEGADHPFWSPDSRVVAFFADEKLKKIDAAGGPPVTLCDATNSARGGSWSTRDIILFAPSPGSGILQVPAAGGTPALVKKPGRFPWFLPDGRHFLYITFEPNGAGHYFAGLYFAALDSKAEQRVLVADTNAMYVPPGYLLFMRDGTLLAQPFDAGSGKTTGEPAPIAEHVGSIISNGQGQFSGSQSAAGPPLVAYTSADPFEGQLTWYDRSGNALGFVGKPAFGLRPSISPDGSTVAVDRADPRTGAVNVWLLDIKRETETRLTFRDPRNHYPVWSPDGSRVAFNSGRNLAERVVTGAGQSNGAEDLLDSARESERQVYPTDWSRDGRYIIERVEDPRIKAQLWVLPLAGDRKPFRYLQTESNTQEARLSPNGRWLAYVSDESSRFEVYVQTFPNPGNKSQISIDGGSLPVWRRDGKELYFIAPDGKVMAVAVKGAAVNDSARFQAGKPMSLFDSRLPIYAGAQYDVGNDGRFLIPTPIEPPGAEQINLVVNWTAVLRK